MTYEDTAFSLHQEIANRKPSKRTYNEEELMLLLYSLLQGAKEFQRMDMHVGDIRTKNILITKGSDVKMVNVVSFPGEKTAVDKILDRFDNTTIFFLGNPPITQRPRKLSTSRAKATRRESLMRTPRPGLSDCASSKPQLSRTRKPCTRCPVARSSKIC